MTESDCLLGERRNTLALFAPQTFTYLPTNAAILSNISPLFDRSGAWPGGAVHVDVFERDIAAGLLIGGAEALRFVAGERRFRILVVVQGVVAALEPDRGRHEHHLAALEDHGRVAVSHVGLVHPVRILPPDDRLRPVG